MNHETLRYIGQRREILTVLVTGVKSGGVIWCVPFVLGLMMTEYYWG